MLVYANAFDAADSASLNDLFAVVARWLTRKEFPRTSAEDLSSDGRHQYRSGAYVEIVRANDPNLLYSLRYAHADSDVAGREWFVEIGLTERRPGALSLSVVLRTEEISSRVIHPIDATRPTLVLELANKGLLEPSTPGLDLLQVEDEYAAEGLRYSLAIADRKHPYVLISPTLDGTYLVEPELVRQAVVGLADVVRIPPGADTYQITNVLGKEFSAWRGAVNVILPARQRPETFVPTVKLLPDMLAEVRASGRRIETEILAAVTHRTNRPMFAQHVAPGAVRDRKQRQELSRRKSDAEQKGDLREWIALLEEENSDLRRNNEALSGQLLDEQIGRDDDSRRSEEEIGKIRYQNESLKLRMDDLAESRIETDEASLDDIRDAVLAVIGDHATAEQSLLLIKRFFADRIEVLPSALKSAKQSSEFRYADRLFDLLRKLSTEYYEAIASGKGDTQARRIFGDAYSARDSEGVENNRRASDLRTFEYRGVPVEMQQHLKIGVKPSAAETIRVHFMWDAERERLVIGHCGPHLNHR